MPSPTVIFTQQLRSTVDAACSCCHAVIPTGTDYHLVLWPEAPTRECGTCYRPVNLFEFDSMSRISVVEYNGVTIKTLKKPDNVRLCLDLVAKGTDPFDVAKETGLFEGRRIEAWAIKAGLVKKKSDRKQRYVRTSDNRANSRIIAISRANPTIAATIAAICRELTLGHDVNIIATRHKVSDAYVRDAWAHELNPYIGLELAVVQRAVAAQYAEGLGQSKAA